MGSCGLCLGEDVGETVPLADQLEHRDRMFERLASESREERPEAARNWSFQPEDRETSSIRAQLALLEPIAGVPGHWSATREQGARAKTPAATPRESSRRIGLASAFWLAACLLVAGFFGLRAIRGPLTLPRDERPLAVAPQATRATTNIEDIRPTHKVEANDPELADDGYETEVDPATWKLVTLQAIEVWPDGTVDDINVQTVQSPAWLAENQVEVGASVPLPLDLVEMGLPATLRAKVLAIDRCRKIPDGPGRVVLTTVNHLNNDVWELKVVDEDGHTTTIQPTGFHKFYSEDRGEWVSACLLEPDEEIRALGRPVTVLTSRHLPGIHRVYNLTVERDHVYYVSDFGALVHNMGCDDLVDLTDAKGRKHILDGDANGGGHRPGTGKPNKTEFPDTWSDEKILHEISDVATDPRITPGVDPKTGRLIHEGTRDGVDIRVITEPDGGRIVTGHPTNLPRNPK